MTNDIQRCNGTFTQRVNVTYGTTYKDQLTLKAWQRVLSTDKSFLGKSFRIPPPRIMLLWNPASSYYAPLESRLLRLCSFRIPLPRIMLL